jgi:hypothetical protein
MMKETAVGSYRDADGAHHELVVRESADGGWHVLDVDVNGETVQLVDALSGDQDGRPQAEAIARDYLSIVDGTANAGRRSADPISGQGGSDARSCRRPPPGPRRNRARGASLPRAAR